MTETDKNKVVIEAAMTAMALMANTADEALVTLEEAKDKILKAREMAKHILDTALDQTSN